MIHLGGLFSFLPRRRVTHGMCQRCALRELQRARSQQLGAPVYAGKLQLPLRPLPRRHLVLRGRALFFCVAAILGMCSCQPAGDRPHAYRPTRHPASAVLAQEEQR